MRSPHGSSEGHFMLKRHDICRSIADVELIPKMCFKKNRSMTFFKKGVFELDTISFSLAVWPDHVLNSRYILSSPAEYLPREEQRPQQKIAENTNDDCHSWH